jgi:hypothetical protein
MPLGVAVRVETDVLAAGVERDVVRLVHVRRDAEELAVQPLRRIDVLDRVRDRLQA